MMNKSSFGFQALIVGIRKVNTSLEPTSFNVAIKKKDIIKEIFYYLFIFNLYKFILFN